MLKKWLPALLFSTTILLTPTIINADVDTSVITSSDYVTLNSDMSNYQFPNGTTIKFTPSFKIGINLKPTEYLLTDIDTTPDGVTERQHHYELKLTHEGEVHVGMVNQSLPDNYVMSESSEDVIGEFLAFDDVKTFSTGAKPTAKNTAPDVDNVMYTVELVGEPISVRSQAELKKAQADINKLQTDMQAKISELTKDQQQFVVPKSATLTVNKSDIVDVTTPAKVAKADQQTKKIVPLDALKQAKNAESIDTAKENAKKSANTKHKILIVSSIIIGLVAIGTLATVIVKKFVK